MRSPPTARVTLPPLMPVSERPAMLVKVISRPGLLTASESTSLSESVSVTVPAEATMLSELVVMAAV